MHITGGLTGYGDKARVSPLVVAYTCYTLFHTSYSYVLPAQCTAHASSFDAAPTVMKLDRLGTGTECSALVARTHYARVQSFPLLILI